MRVVSICFYIVLSLFLMPISKAEAFIYTESFLNSSALNYYTVNSNGGSVIVDSDSLVISSPFGNTYPLIQLSNPDLKYPLNAIEVKFKYSDIGRFGAGIVIDEIYPILGVPYDVGTNSLLWTWNWGEPPLAKIGYYQFVVSDLQTQTDFHIMKIYGSPGNYFINLDNVEIGRITSLKKMNALWIGNPQTTNTNDNWPTITIDYIRVFDNDEQIPEVWPSAPPAPVITPSPTPNGTASPSPSIIPSSSPSASAVPSVAPSPAPSMTPSPTPIAASLPYLSQKDPAWGKQLYDHANKWAGQNNRSIANWGCALTSVTMVLQKYGVKNYSGQPITPSQLNAWLKIQEDGYLGNGLLNWLAVSRYVRESRMSGRASTNLEFRKEPYDMNNVSSYIDEGKYPILGLPGHFVTSYAQNSSNYLIHDPADKAKIFIGKSSLINSNNVYTPSNTDLSYILFTYPPGMELKLKNQNGEEIFGDVYEEYLDDALTEKTSKMLITKYYPKPENGKYTIEVSNPGEEKLLKSYLYDEKGNVLIKEREIKSQTETAINLKYDKKKISKCDIEPKWLWSRFFSSFSFSRFSWSREHR